MPLENPKIIKVVNQHTYALQLYNKRLPLRCSNGKPYCSTPGKNIPIIVWNIIRKW